jgi:hypothetical protein
MVYMGTYLARYSTMDWAVFVGATYRHRIKATNLNRLSFELAADSFD